MEELVEGEGAEVGGCLWVGGVVRLDCIREDEGGLALEMARRSGIST